MTTIYLYDAKGDLWELIWAGACTRYVHKGKIYWTAWWYAPNRPRELRNYKEISLPIFTEWWI